MAQDYFSIMIDGRERDIKMTFGLLNTLCKMVGDIDSAALLNADPELRTRLLVELLSHRDSRGKVTEEVDLDTIVANPGDIMDLLEWAGDHVFDFFLKGLEKTKALQDRHIDRIKALTPSLAGSKP